MGRDFAEAMRAASELGEESWFIDQTRDSLAIFGPDLERSVAPTEAVALVLAAAVDAGGARPGLLALVNGSRLVLFWAEDALDGPHRWEAYTLDSVPATVTVEEVAGIPGQVHVLQLSDRRVVLPTAGLAQRMLATFTASPDGAPAADQTSTTTVTGWFLDETSTAYNPGPTSGHIDPYTPPDTDTSGSGDKIRADPALAATALPMRGASGLTQADVTTRSAQGPASGSGTGPANRRPVVVVAAVLGGLVLLGGIVFLLQRATQAAWESFASTTASRSDTPSAPTQPTRAGSPAVKTAAPKSATPAPTRAPASSRLPRAADPLPANQMIVRRKDSGGTWKIETMSSDGSPGTLLATGRNNRGAVLSPDRRTVLYLSEAYGIVTLRAVGADGSGETDLFTDGTTSCPRMGQPALRADGTLAIVCVQAMYQPGALYLMRLDGTVLQTLDKGRLGDPTFTRDGKKVVYWRGSAPKQVGGDLVITDVSGAATPVVLASGSGGAFDDPACSPTGDLVAASRGSGTDRQIVTVSLGTGREVRRLTSVGVVGTGPGWSPDGSQLAFTDGTGEDTSLVVMDADGTQPRWVLPPQGYLSSPVWSAH